MSGASFSYFLKEALSAFSRHKAMSAAALITMAAALGVLVLFLVWLILWTTSARAISGCCKIALKEWRGLRRCSM
jgi:cell division protein FtsX